MSGFDFNIVLIPLLGIFGTFSFFSGGFLIIRSVLRFRISVSQSMQMDLEMVKVSRVKRNQETQQNQSADAWREEIIAMEQFLTSLSSLKWKASSWKQWFYQAPNIVLEVANPSSSEEIFFYLSMPKRFRENIEKQLHSFFPNAVIEKVSDYTVFSPDSATAVVLVSKNHALPPGHTGVSNRPFEQISNALSRLNTEAEVQLFRLCLRPRRLVGGLRDMRSRRKCRAGNGLGMRKKTR
jgi:hypothetical protein